MPKVFIILTFLKSNQCSTQFTTEEENNGCLQFLDKNNDGSSVNKKSTYRSEQRTTHDDGNIIFNISFLD